MAEVSTTIKALSIGVSGIVQGVGFRPFVYRLANELSLKGWVVNRSDGVLIHVEGECHIIENFVRLLRDQSPPAATISRMESHAVSPGNYTRFIIQESQSFPGSITGISPDIAVCPECMEDMKIQPHRLAYPLINCTNCGPRFSIISGLPYDREQTSMDHFAMCAVCEQEYLDPDNRRFHAQPVACNNCGPVYRMEIYDAPDCRIPLDIEKLSGILEDGGVVTLKGTGGYNLVCDAMNWNAVERIREIKGRERKPFAVMFMDVEKVKEYCMADEKELELLQSWRRPVVLLRQGKSAETQNMNPGNVNGMISSGAGSVISSCSGVSIFPAAAGRISPNVSGGLNTVGAILPYMPFHYLLFEKLKLQALVFTSANISGDPMVADDDKARSLFSAKTDALVFYSREIVNPVDDSVCRLAGGNIRIIRRARGYVPEMINLPFVSDGIFAAGSDLKNTFAIGKDNHAILSQHIGDLEHYRIFNCYRIAIECFSSLYSFKPACIACDLHPDYHSAKFAVGLAGETGSRLIRVQHHHAHIASCMAESGLDEPVIGVCFDGTGLGDDGNIWGSEFMICDYSGYDRQGHFSYIQLPGGDAAIREPWRIALACLMSIGHRDTEKWIGATLNEIPEEKIETVGRMIINKINTPLSCGAGRLFDAVATLLGLCSEAGYDGEGPMLLESICCPETVDGYEFSTDTLLVIDQVMADLKRGTAPEVIASRFHNGMAKTVRDRVSHLHKTTGIDKVVLSGGVFQNSYLLNRVMQLLGRDKIRVFVNKMVPVNDGGLALGQLAIAAKKMGESCA